MSSWRELWNLEVLGNTLGTWAVALGIFLVTFAFRPLLKRLLALHNARRAARTGAAAHPMLDLALELVAAHQPAVPVGHGRMARLARPHLRRRAWSAGSPWPWCCCSGCRWRCGR